MSDTASYYTLYSPFIHLYCRIYAPCTPLIHVHTPYTHTIYTPNTPLNTSYPPHIHLIYTLYAPYIHHYTTGTALDRDLRKYASSNSPKLRLARRATLDDVCVIDPSGAWKSVVCYNERERVCVCVIDPGGGAWKSYKRHRT